jgi:hypothetical protein
LGISGYVFEYGMIAARHAASDDSHQNLAQRRKRDADVATRGKGMAGQMRSGEHHHAGFQPPPVTGEPSREPGYCVQRVLGRRAGRLTGADAVDVEARSDCRRVGRAIGTSGPRTAPWL